MQIQYSPYEHKILQINIIALDGCLACETLINVLYEILTEDDLNKISFKINYLKKSSDIKSLGLRQISGLPLLLAYKNGKLRLGWEGFAALAPDEIKREMVEDVLRQVAALADEDDGDVPHEMPQQVWHDN